MARDVKPRESSKKILVVGQLGYHEENIIKPILNELVERGHSIERMGGNWDFFIPANYDKMVKNYTDSIPNSLEGIDLVFFVDYWNMVLPIFNYLRSICSHSVEFIGLFHGSVDFDHDVAQDIHRSDEYEGYLWKGYDRVIVHDQWIHKELSDFRTSLHVSYFPFTLQFSRTRKFCPPIPRVIFAHRFAPDKGKDEFLEFVNYCTFMGENIEFLVTDEGKNCKEVQYIGRLTQDQLKNFCSWGGYAWSSARSEMAHYAVMDLISYGLTPLLNYHPAYHYFDSKYKYHNHEEALQIIKSETYFTNQEWDELNEKLNRLNNLVDVILGE